MVGMFDVDDLTNKVDVGSLPGTMWSLSSQKPGHGIAELRDDDASKLWQSDGFLPHLINIQFAQRTAVTHVSLYLDFRSDDSYTPIKIRVMAGTHYHDLIEVRTREFVQPEGWKHFVMDKFDSVAESEESDSGSSSSSTFSDDLSDGTTVLLERQRRPRRRANPDQSAGLEPHRASPLLAVGVSKKHTPIYTYLVQVCILANHAVGKDTHVRGIKIFGPPTAQSREKAKRDAKKSRESRRITGSRAIRLRQEKEAKRKKRAKEALVRWVQDDEEQGNEAGQQQQHAQDGDDTEEGIEEIDRIHRLSTRISTSRTLELFSTLR